MVAVSRRIWKSGDRDLLAIGRPLVMGVVNVTPDSFSGGIDTQSSTLAINHALELVEKGADIIDIGGESTRPGATPVTADEECRRVIPVIRALVRETNIPVSIDTMKASVAWQACDMGASIINDVSALADPDMASVALRAHAAVVLMHMRGTPANMQENPEYLDVTAEVMAHLAERVARAMDAGIEATRLCLDPGIGFGKTLEHNITLMRQLGQLRQLNLPILLGVSRKSFLGHITGRPVAERLAATLAAQAVALVRGNADIIRAHDVREAVDLVRVVTALADNPDGREDACSTGG